MEGVCSGDSDEADIPCVKTGAYGTSNRELDCAYAICVVDWFRVSDEDGAGLCCMDRHLRHVRGLRPHGSISIATNGGDISIDGVTGHPDVTLSTLGGDIEMLLPSDAFSGTYSLTAPKGGVEMSEKRFRTGYQFPAEVMTSLFPNSTAGFEAIIVPEQTQLGDEISTDGLARVLPLRGRVLSAEGGPYVGTQKMTMDAAAGSITICLTESVGGAKWGGNRTYVEKEMANAGGDPNTAPTTQCEIVTRSWTGPSDLDAEPDGSAPWFQPRGGAPYHSILNDQGEPELQGRWN